MLHIFAFLIFVGCIGSGLLTQEILLVNLKGKFPESYSVVALTGGSSGIGLSFIKAILNVNDSLRVCNLSRTIPAEFKDNPRVTHIPCDLTDEGQAWGEAVPQIRSIIESETGTGKVLLINNSGFGSYGAFPMPNPEHHVKMLRLNVEAPLRLTAELLPILKQRGGAIINVASVAGFQPTPYMATYGATKAFLLNWSLALGQDLRESGIQVLAVCPGPTATNFFRAAGFEKAPLSGFKGQTADEVVEESLHALSRGRSLVVNGTKNKLMVFFTELVPKRLQAPIARIVLKKMRLDKL